MCLQFYKSVYIITRAFAISQKHNSKERFLQVYPHTARKYSRDFLQYSRTLAKLKDCPQK